MSRFRLFFICLFIYISGQVFCGILGKIVENIGILLGVNALICIIAIGFFLKDKLVWKPVDLRQFLLLLIYFIGLFVIVGIMAQILKYFVGSISDTDVVLLIRNSSNANLFGLFFLAVIGAPIIEEFIFRQLLFEGFLEKERPYLAYVISSFAFALIHFQFTLIPIYFVIGLVFAYSYTKHRNIIISIMLHSLWNFFTFLAILLGLK